MKDYCTLVGISRQQRNVTVFSFRVLKQEKDRERERERANILLSLFSREIFSLLSHSLDAIASFRYDGGLIIALISKLYGESK